MDNNIEKEIQSIGERVTDYMLEYPYQSGGFGYIKGAQAVVSEVEKILNNDSTYVGKIAEIKELIETLKR